MKERILPLAVIFVWLISAVLVPSVNAQDSDDWRSLSADIDDDGLTNETEENGWENAAGFFTTDPLDADSDDDGLLDGQEKLFDTNPNDDTSPGIYVEYQDHLKTIEYFARDSHSPSEWGWQQHGSKFISLDPDPNDPEVEASIVVRRGATFSVGGPVDATFQIIKSQDGVGPLSDLAWMQDHCVGRWTITVPPDGTVGKYTIRLERGGWNKELNLYVIFELSEPSPDFTQTMIDTFLYDDDPDNIRDEIGVNLGVREYDHDDYEWIPEGDYYVAAGTGYDFELQQFEPFVLEEHVIEAINGYDNQWDAAKAIVARADKVLRFDYPRVLYDSWQALHPGSNDKNQCSNHAGLLTAFYRSAGIPARPFFVDWRHSSFDHSTEVWLNGTWWASRAYTKVELEGCGWDCEYGHRNPQSRYWWGYKPYYSGTGDVIDGFGNMVFSADESWVLGELSRNSAGIPSRHEYRWANWDINNIVRKDWFDTVATFYWSRPDWDWTEEPEIVGTPPDDWPDPPPGGLGGLEISSTSGSSPVQFGQVVTDYGIDLDNDGYFDQLVIEVEVIATQPGDYWIQGMLGSDHFEQFALVGTGGDISASVVHTHLTEGLQTIQLVFEGTDISLMRVDGPYTLDLWITDVENPGPTEFNQEWLDFRDRAYTTAAYQATDFETFGAMLTDTYSHYSVDSDGNGYPDTLIVETSIDVQDAGTYTVIGDLYDNLGEWVAQATWSGSGPAVTLQFKEVGGTAGPYTLEDLYLFNADEKIIDSRIAPYTIEQIPDLTKDGLITLDLYLPPPGGGIGILGETITPTHVFSDSGVDLDDDDLYDQLVVDVQVDVSEANQYRVEGWLEDPDGSLIVYAISDSVSLDTGLQTLSLAFDGRAINGRGLDGPYTVTALKILDGANYDVLDGMEETGLALNYNASDFEPATDMSLGFSDNMENGTDNWTWDNPPWILNDSVWHSASHAWRADESGLLTTVPIDLSNYVNPTLRFNTCYNMQSVDDVGYLEAFDGLGWTTVATYTNSTPHWETVLLESELSDFHNIPNLQLRFNANSQSGLLWYIDDVYLINVWPDTDGDGLSNEEEIAIYGTDPNDPDSDDDGLLDGEEVNTHNTDPLDGDSDDDNLTDGQEVNGAGTNPNNPDSDGDGIPDDVEVGGDPNNPLNTDGVDNIDALDADSDDDGILDATEWDIDQNDSNNDDLCSNNGLDTDEDSIPNCQDNDADGDGIPNYRDENTDGEDDPDAVEGTDDDDADDIPNFLDSDINPNTPRDTTIFLPIIFKQ
jgi:hypothetical protein